MHTKQIRQVAFGCLLAGVGSAALADWNFSFQNKPSGATVQSTPQGSTVTATASAFSVANTSVTTRTTSTTTRQTDTTTESFNSGATFAAATLTGNGTSGLGVAYTNEPTGSPNHSVDNKTQTDMIMFSFGAGNKFILDKINLGWTQTDADITLLRYVGTGGPGMDGTPTWDNMKVDANGNGWEVVQNVNYTGNNLLDVNDAGLSSSWWIVSAFNTSFGGEANGANSGQVDTRSRTYSWQSWSSWSTTDKRDYFKLAGLTGTFAPPESNGVPEPGSLALLGVAALGLLGTRRRMKQQG